MRRAASLVLGIAACGGPLEVAPGGPSGVHDSDPLPSETDTPTDGTAGDSDTPLPATDPWFPYLRRLSQAEYAASVADLFPGLALPDLTLPADPAPLGYDNDAVSLAASRGLVQRYQSIAQEVSLVVWRNLDAVVHCDLRRDHEACVEATIADLGERAFRRPLTADEHTLARLSFDEEPGLSDPDNGVRLLVELLLQSPPFLYRLERPAGPPDADGWAPIDAWALASRLSYLLWATSPDEALRQAARDGSLLTQAGYDAQVERLIDSPRLEGGMLRFWEQWAEFKRMSLDNKPVEYQWSASGEEVLRQHAGRFIADVYARNGTLTDLFTDTTTDISTADAYMYTLTPPPAGETESVTLDPAQRSGLITLAPFLVGHSHGVVASPVLRGVFVLRKMYCVPLGNPPPVGAATVLPQPAPGRSNRDLITSLTSPPACQGCHEAINGAGFLFEHYDGLGRWVDADAGSVVDASGSVNGQDFPDAVPFLHHAATDPAVVDCLARHWLTYAWGGDAAERAGTGPAVLAAWAAAPGLRDLLRATVAQPRFRQVPVVQEGAP